MLAEQFKQKRYEAGFVEGYSEEVAKARAEMQGLDQADLENSKAWKKLKKDAEEEARHMLRCRQHYRAEPGSISISERFLKRRYEAGYAEGLVEMQRRQDERNDRRLEAEAKGQPFNEPPPTLENHK